jgi:hypothetical protein
MCTYIAGQRSLAARSIEVAVGQNGAGEFVHDSRIGRLAGNGLAIGCMWDEPDEAQSSMQWL